MQKTCKQCNKEFEIFDEDLRFYEKVSPIFGGKKELILPPTFCPDCRQMRRLAYRNERNLYKRKCDLTGENIISVYSENFGGKVYGHDAWHSDKWSALKYGRDFDFFPEAGGFFEQFSELSLEVPRVCFINWSSENSLYSNYAAYNKNCYMLINSAYCENLLYCGNYNLHNKNCVDCTAIQYCEMCYFCTNVKKSRFCKYLYECEACGDCNFCYDCQGCKDLFCCSNLRHKRYCIYNKQYSPGEYKQKLEEIMPHTRSEYSRAFERWKEFMKKEAIHKNLFILNGIDCGGDHLENCKNVKDSFYVFDSQDCRYNYDSGKMKDCYDVVEPFDEELLYEVQGSFNSYHNLFCVFCHESKNCIYSQYCLHCNDCFGCAGMNRNQYCVFNKQYTKEEYEELVPRIIEHMRKIGEWGEFFPIAHSSLAYNETTACFYYPMSKEEVLAKGWKWKELEDTGFEGEKFVPPERIEDVGDDICDKILICERSGRPFKIIEAELRFYRRMALPIPLLHPEERFKDRMNLRNPRKLITTNCTKCGIGVDTTFSEGSVDKIYCEKCYLEEIY